MIRELWERLRSNGPGWYWIGAFAHHGDLYHACSLAEAFRAEHGEHLPLRLVVSTRSQAAVASLFQDQFASVILESHLPALRADWRGLCEEAGLPPFGIGLQWLSVRSELEWRFKSGAIGALKAALGR